MSILNNIFHDLRSILYPRRCLVCGKTMDDTEAMVCPICLSQISITRFWNIPDNSMAERARDLQPFIEQGAALFFYDSKSRPLIHNIKYYGFWRGARYLGELLGDYLFRSELYTDIDVVIPVPIHPMRRLKRKYNQSEYIAQGIATKMEVTTNFRSLRRARYSTPQAQKRQVDRWHDNKGGFIVQYPEQLNGKHILLVDDVYTTGATIYRCADALNDAIPNCKISIATLATSHK